MSYQIELIVYIYFRFDCIFILYIFDENGWFKCIYYISSFCNLVVCNGYFNQELVYINLGYFW